MLVRLAYLAVSKAFTVLRLLPMSDREKDVEILALRHQISVLQRQLGATRPRFEPGVDGFCRLPCFINRVRFSRVV